jgi:hypothetical protein
MPSKPSTPTTRSNGPTRSAKPPQSKADSAILDKLNPAILDMKGPDV